MPHYYFHVYDEDMCLDDEGQQLADLAAAIRAATSGARDLACAEAMRGELDLSHRVDVADEQGEVVASISFGEAAGVLPGPRNGSTTVSFAMSR